MNQVLLGIAGTGFGVLLKFGIDLVTESRGNTRHDIVWRRERYVDAAGGLLEAARAMSADHSAVVISTISLTNVQQRLNPGPEWPAQMQTHEDRWAESHRIYHEHEQSATHHLEMLRLYAPEAVVAAAERVESEARLRLGQMDALERQAAIVTDACGVLTAEVRRTFEPEPATPPWVIHNDLLWPSVIPPVLAT